jgi:hypothetical protein
MANDRAVAPRPSRSADDLDKDPRAPRHSQARSGTLQAGSLSLLFNPSASVSCTCVVPALA